MAGIITRATSFCFNNALIIPTTTPTKMPKFTLHVNGGGRNHSSHYSKLSSRRPSIKAQALDASSIEFEKATGQREKKANYEEMLMVGFKAMHSANSSLEDFMDNLNEKLMKLPADKDAVLDEGDEMGERNGNWTAKQIHLLKTDPFAPVAAKLESLGLLTERIMKELKAGGQYWALERELCPALKDHKKISIDDVMIAVYVKSFDYRAQNLLLYQLRGEKVNELHMKFLSYSEFLMEVSDDLFDYEDDVIENNFNVLRFFIRIYGPSAGPVMLAKHITEAEEKYDSLLKALDPQLSLNYRRRREDVAKEASGKVSGHPFGTASIPPVIEDEELYRSNYWKSRIMN